MVNFANLAGYPGREHIIKFNLEGVSPVRHIHPETMSQTAHVEPGVERPHRSGWKIPGSDCYDPAFLLSRPMTEEATEDR